MPRIPLVTRDSIDATTAKMISDGEGADWDGVWNVTKTLANAPAALEIFFAIHRAMPRSSLSRKEREVIELSMAVINGCHYCVPAHIKGARDGGLNEADIKAIVEGQTVAQPRLRLIQELLHALIETKGRLTDEDFDDFQERGVTSQQMIDVIADIAHCTLTNYTNRLAGTEFDSFLEGVTVDTPQ